MTDDVCGAERRDPEFDGPDLISKCTRKPHDDPDHDGPIGDPMDPVGWAYWREPLDHVESAGRHKSTTTGPR